MVDPARAFDDRLSPLLSGEAGYRALARHFPNGSVCLFDHDLRYAIADGAGLADFGLSKDDLEGKTVWEVFPDDVAEFLRPKFEVALGGGSMSFEVAREDASWVARVVPVEDEAGHVVGGMVMTQNVTAERRTEQALREAEAKYRSLVESIPAAVFIDDLDQHGSNLYISPQVEEMLGYPLEHWQGDPRFWLTILHPDDRDRVLDSNARILSMHGRFVDEYRLIAKDGRVVWVHEESAEVADQDGRPVCRQGVWLEITERKEAEQALRRSEEKFRAFVETTREWIWAIDREGRHMYNNPAVAEILGYEPEELIGTLSTDLMHDEDREKVLELLPQWVEQRQGWTGLVFRWRRRDGSYRYLESNAVPILDPEGELVGYRGADRDVTERVLAEQERQQLLSQLVQAQERERQVLAADIHDDPIQKMTAVGFRLGVLRREDLEPAQLVALAQAQESVSQAIARLRHFVFDLHPRALDSEGLAAALRLHLLELETESGIEFKFEDGLLDNPGSDVRAIAYRVAKEALTNVRKHSHATTAWVTLAQEGTELRVSIRDDGEGFDDRSELSGHVGFSSMRERVHLAGGRFRVSSQSGSGTLVDFQLPMA